MPYADIGKVNDVNYHYEILGKNGKPQIVFIAGYTGDINLWRNIAESLAAEYEILIFDPQGSGKTEDTGDELTVESMAANIHSLYKSLDFKKPMIIGFALGAGVSLRIGYQYAADVACLGLVAATLCFNEQAKDWCEQLCSLRERGSDKAFEQAAGLLYDYGFSREFKKNNTRNKTINNLCSIMKVAQSAEGQRRQVEALKNYNAAEWVNDINCNNSLIIIAKEDQFSLPEESMQLANALGVSPYIVEGCGHAILLEKPDSITSLIRKYACKLSVL